MYDVCVIACSGLRLMPTSRVKARKLLKAGKAVIDSYNPFAIKLTYEISKPVVQEIEGKATRAFTLGVVVVFPDISDLDLDWGGVKDACEGVGMSAFVVGFGSRVVFDGYVFDAIKTFVWAMQISEAGSPFVA